MNEEMEKKATTYSTTCEESLSLEIKPLEIEVVNYQKENFRSISFVFFNPMA